MKLQEVLENEKINIFKRYNELYPNDLHNIYDSVDDDYIKYLDIMFNSLYGEKTFNKTVEQYKLNNYDNVIDFICFLLHYNCYEKCLEIKQLNNTSFELGNRTETYTEKTKVNITSQNISNMENVENTYGYDSENPVKDNSTSNTDNNESTQDNLTDKEYKRIYTDKPISELIDNEIKRRINNDFILLTFNIYTNILFIDIYE